MLRLGGAETNVKAVITADDQGSKVLKKFGDNVDGVNHAITSGLKVAAGALAAAGAAAVGFGVLSVKAFSESEDIIAQTNAVLKSTGEVAGVTADQVTELASALERTTKFSDEEVRSAQNLLLTFTKISKDIFPDATKTVLDMSTALGQDLKSSSIQLGKALQDPITGITALRRVGVNFSDAQQDVIKNLIETGRSAEAQRLILKELQTEFGGSAEAAGKTFSGALAKLKNQLNNVQEAIGGLIVNALTPLVTKLAEFVNAIDWEAVIKRTTDALTKLWQDYLVPFGRAVRDAGESIAQYLSPKFVELGEALKALGPELRDFWDSYLGPLLKTMGVALVLTIGLIIDITTEFVRLADKLYNWVGPAIEDLRQVINEDLVPAFKELWKELEPLQPVLEGIAFVLGVVIIGAATSLVTVLVFVAKAFSALVFAATEVIKWFKENFGKLADIVATLTIPIYGLLVKPFVQFLGFIKDIPEKVGEVVTRIAAVLGRLSLGNLGGIGALLKVLPGRASGGPVSKDRPYIVGEEGPEVFVPGNSGTIIPNRPSAGGSAPSGGNVSIVVNVGLYAGSEMEKRKIGLELMQAVRDLAGSRGTTVEQMLGMNNGIHA